MRKILVTEEGYKRLQEELEYLVRNKRREVAERLKEAKGFGDLTENSEYEDAKNEQAFVEGRIAQINEILSRAEIIAGNNTSDAVGVGSLVTLRDVVSGEVFEYRLVSSIESDPLRNLISYESPLGTAILNRKLGEKVRVQIPRGELEYQIVDVK
ncbi:transcription elongation factor GreA [Candidatus Hakubella thermalkaliphila]|uniref:Transcription elongation factor GreA n=2 Tax=Candidatus Hakubella thermalkaliphila TaxID=2754717 RepID=A0A6V8Q320_9ACTN|nr:transcription elongation factor GreA [Candidatus Hakubella thermalkaliphila]GFP22566.1 transcription elongation factor GreA [Candidatus Hakubella thermalkaliphila]GFP30393.1 transcription elongation factor GreA [Candidatus Hakubella thermalkaliphila]GFP36575.1 transcription elongation factor GreA [Candidatus Hakubella thermalkaliphila]GFP38474.1 transcription elongation factor GreA [Candidatus Hakubella thermalkaliphila]